MLRWMDRFCLVALGSLAGGIALVCLVHALACRFGYGWNCE